MTYQTGGGPQSAAFTGPTLWSLLNTVGLQTPAVKNGVLRQYVVATGSDGYSAAFALGELAPNFGGGSPQVLVGYQQNGAPLGSTGFARIVAAEGQLRRPLCLESGESADWNRPALPSAGGGTRTRFSLSGAGQEPGV